MAAIIYNIRIEQGSTWKQGFLPKKGDTPATIAPFLDGTWSAKAQVRPTVGSPTVLHEWSTVIGNITIVSGAAVLEVPPATSTAWTWYNGVYDLEVTKAGETYRIAQGKVVVSREVTI